MTPMCKISAACWMFLLFATGVQLPAQTDALDGELFFDSVDVNIVNIEVLVTDKDGTLVTGLTRDDFEVYEDGKLVELSNFFAVENRQAVMTALEGEGEVDDEYLPTPQTKRLNLVVFVDNLNILPQSRNLIFSSLRDYLSTELDPRDQVMLVTMNDAIQVTQDFTNNVDKLLAALDVLEKQVGRHVQYQADHRLLIRQIQSSRLSQPPGALEPFESLLNFGSAMLDAERAAHDVQQLAERKVQKANATCKALMEFTDSLAGMRGRKAVLYVSDGLHTRPGDSLAQAWLNKFESWVIDVQAEDVRDELRDMTLLIGSSRYDVSNRIQEMVEHASASGVAFYPIAKGSRLLVGGGGSAEFGGAGTVTGQGPTSQDVATLEQFSLETSLLDMAEGTGGIAFTRTANIGGLLELMVRDFENFYSVGYNRPIADQEFHKIEVKVKKQDLKVRYLQTYREKDPMSHLQDLTLAALHYGIEENVLDVRLDAGEPIKTDKNRYRVPITIKIPFQNLLLLPQDDVHIGKLTIVVIARDERGGTSPFQEIEVPLRIPNAQILEVLSGAAAYPLELEMNRGEKTISVGVRDELARVDSTLNLSLTIGEDRPQS